MKFTSTIFLMLSIAAAFFLLNFQNQPIGQTQLTTNDNLPYVQKETIGWYRMKANAQLTVQDLLQRHHADLGFTEWDELKKYRSNTDELGFTHHRFQQYHRGIPVDGAELLVHEKDGFVITFNGEWFSNLNLSATPTFSETVAINQALAFLPAEKYIWDDLAAERMLQRIEKRAEATFYPNPTLAWLDINEDADNPNFKLAYQMEIQAEKPVFKKLVFVDAINQSILLSMEMLHTDDAHGTAETAYNGTRPMVTDSVASGEFRLRETGRGGGIETYNLLQGTEIDDAVDFFDDDNFWNNVNAEQDEVATDAHWGAEATFDYLETVHNYTGIDGEGMPLISYVHFDDGVVNAFWNGNWATFGDGDNARSPLTSLDVVAHEFAHGITGNSARLRYRNESGALNESFSDIFGAVVEFWATPEQGDWLIGEDFHNNGGQFRDMAVPNAEGHPDTYFGDNWFIGDGDFGGVHTNSGVQNHWFYLLSVGGTGENDNGETFDVIGLGLDTASTIAFRNLRFYLTRNSTYFDAREGALQSAEDLYGVCSYEVTQTGNAWFAVGLGNGFADNDLRLLNIAYPDSRTCGLEAEEYPVIQFRYNGCMTPLESGLKIPITAQVDGGPLVQDSVLLTEIMEAADTIDFTFTLPVSGLETGGDHVLRVWTALENDPFGLNDTLSNFIFNIIEQNSDFGGRNAPTPAPACFLTTRTVESSIIFLGCDSIEAGTELMLNFSINDGAVVTESVTLPITLYTFDEFNYTFNTPADFSNDFGRNALNSWVTFPNDFLNDNDDAPVRFVTNPKLMTNDNLVTFEADVVSLDSIYFTANNQAFADTAGVAAATGEKGVLMSGGNFVFAFENGEALHPNLDSIWNINEQFNAQSCVCVNAMDMDIVTLSFDLKQTNSATHFIEFGEFNRQASSMRVLVNQEPVSETFNPSSINGDPFIRHFINLDDWAGLSFEVCFETRNMISRESDPTNRGDNSYIDNVLISDDLVSTSNVYAQFKGIQVFPNPTSGQFNVTWESEFSGNLILEVFDVFGKQVQQITTTNQIGQNSVKVNLAEVAAGAYFVRISDGNQSIVQRIAVF